MDLNKFNPEVRSAIWNYRVNHIGSTYEDAINFFINEFIKYKKKEGEEL